MPHPINRKPEDAQLKGWAEIAKFLGQPIATAQRWAKSGMPVSRKGRYTYASSEELSNWLGHESGLSQSVYIARNDTDLAAGLRRAVSQAQKRRRLHRVK
jgi:phage terminase Nu1 subunit (DNA packaging protein)